MDANTASDFGKKHVAKGLNRLDAGVITSGSGSYVQFADGRKMLDFTCGIGVTNLGKYPSPTLYHYMKCAKYATSIGHCHPKVSEAAAKQCMTLVHGQVKHPLMHTRITPLI